MATAGTVQPDQQLVETARKLCAEIGAKDGAARLGIAMSAFLRIAAGGGVRAGTVALATAALKANGRRK